MQFDLTLARNAITQIDPQLADRFCWIIQFLGENPSLARSLKNIPLGSDIYISRQASNYAGSRNPRAPQPPTTVPDQLVSLILHKYFKVELQNLAFAQQTHLLSMGAENLIGDLLERYIASQLEPHGWIWCPGALVKAVDFIRPVQTSSGVGWQILQIKNRDNSENSSSSAIRNGTSIEKWFRTFSKNGATNWDKFPDATAAQHLSEQGFHSFVEQYLNFLLSQENRQ